MELAARWSKLSFTKKLIQPYVIAFGILGFGQLRCPFLNKQSSTGRFLGILRFSWAVLLMAAFTLANILSLYKIVQQHRGSLDSGVLFDFIAAVQRSIVTFLGIVCFHCIYNRYVKAINELEHVFSHHLNVKDQKVIALYAAIIFIVWIVTSATYMYTNERNVVVFERQISSFFSLPPGLPVAQIFSRILILGDGLMNSGFSLVQCFPVLLCAAAGKCYGHINSTLYQAPPELVAVEKILNEHYSLSRLVQRINRLLSSTFFFVYINVVCTILSCIIRAKTGVYQFPPSFISTCLYTAIGTPHFIWLYEQGEAIKDSLHDIGYQLPRRDRFAMHFLIQRSSSVTVVFNIGGFFAIDRTFIATLAGGILTFALVVDQLQSKPMSLDDLNSAFDFVSILTFFGIFK
ncbi:uncharacterized protein LOC129592806 [Paramacrobiotus metropolitanus]|uniref:uncharacterized protein LOC129592806 n=1 Tax=Paramacrobiotus metropolitanus TaxID=2943436 RepID=UPI002445E32F|nr:uncharacterized protein LOC129592806 [Paramacrobiotus metropolitanus]